MEDEKFLDLKLKVKGLRLCDIFYTETKKDLIELTLQSKECRVEPAYSTLFEIARREKIKNHTILTTNELKKAIELASEDDNPDQNVIHLQGETVAFNSLLAKKR